MTLRIATLNVCGLPSWLSRLPPIEDRAAGIGRSLEASEVDVFTVQELWGRRSARALQRHLPSFRHVAWHAAASGGPAGGVATFSRRPLGPVRYRSFAGTAPRTSTPSFRAWRALNARRQGMLAVTLDDVLIVTTHLTANKDGDWSEGNRYYQFHRDQLAVLHAFVRERGPARQTVLTGDFNIASRSPLHRFVTEDGAWHDPFEHTDLTTFRAEYLPRGSTVHRIDYILLDGPAEAHDARALFADEVLSDHVGLTLALRGGTRVVTPPPPV
ncbi:endonuclease/exonuclease/phosphatase family protein [Cryptosporangium arvum]|uniref:Exonuclease III n=1 Tax=Cryptosporangium arvum DSM 44712 TaxID=927661 RepID=A0A010ZT24_9ACTN|nr:endonuclease/exonuclease/phosphatase family protein [Cryptosporangium arvum]EXG81839.1 exonuclease III [Cryptosporangium arvum DSM 44712]